MYEYVPLISGGKNPEIEEKDEFKVIIPYIDDDGSNVPQDVPQDVPQGVPQDGIQDMDLDERIENQIIQHPNITREELASLKGITVKTIQRHISKMPHIMYVGSGYSGHWEVTDKK